MKIFEIKIYTKNESVVNRIRAMVEKEMQMEAERIDHMRVVVLDALEGYINE